MLELDSLRIAVAMEKVDNPLLLLWRQQLLPAIVAVILLFALTLLLNPFAKVRKIGCVHFLQTFFLEVT